MISSNLFAGSGIDHDVASTQTPYFLLMHGLVALPLRVTRTRKCGIGRILAGQGDARIGHHMQ